MGGTHYSHAGFVRGDAPTPTDLQAARDLPADKRALLLGVLAGSALGRQPYAVAAELGMHPRRFEAAATAWARNDWYAWGVSHRVGWLTAKGQAVAEAVRGGG